MDMTQYTGHLKKLTNAPRDISQPINETSQVLNLLRSLNSKYQLVIPVITAKHPPHNFLFAHSYLILEEHNDGEHANAATHHALVAIGGSLPPPPPSSDGGSKTSSSDSRSSTSPNPLVVTHNNPPHSDNNH